MKNLEQLPQSTTDTKVDNWKKAHFLSQENRDKFLKHFARTMNMAASARVCGVTRRAVDQERQLNPEFAGLMQEILDSELDTLEEEQHAAAHERSDDRRFVLSRRRAEVWGDKRQTQVSGHISIGRDVKTLTDAELEDIVLRGKLPTEAEFTVEGEVDANQQPGLELPSGEGAADEEGDPP